MEKEKKIFGDSRKKDKNKKCWKIKKKDKSISIKLYKYCAGEWQRKFVYKYTEHTMRQTRLQLSVGERKMRCHVQLSLVNTQNTGGWTEYEQML